MGCFTIKIQRNELAEPVKTKWRVRPVFSITLHIKDLPLLEAIQNTLGVGSISKSKKVVIFAVDSIKEISVIINHFDKYPLITHKLSDYLIFKQCTEIIKQLAGGSEHLTERGLLDIISLKSNLNLGLPNNLKNAFPNIKAKDRPEFIFKGIPDPFWVTGFTSGDGSFHIVLKNGPRQDRKSGVFARFSIHLHIRELEVLKGIATYLNLYPSCIAAGGYGTNFFYHSLLFTAYATKEPAGGPADKKIIILEKSANLQIAKFADILDIIIPFFNQYPILGMKSLDFEDFKKVCNIMKTKDHLINPLVFNQILQIKSGMNLNRKW